MQAQHILQETWRQLEHVPYRKELLIGLAAVVVAVVAAVGYRWHRAGAQADAQQALSQAMNVYHQAMRSSRQPEADQLSTSWQEVELAFKSAYDKHKGTGAAPLMLAYQAEALSQQGRNNEAIFLLDDMLTQLPKDSPIYDAYVLKRALYKLDSEDEARRESGFNELDSLAHSSSVYQDAAQFYLGEYYWAQGEFEKARTQFSGLMPHPGAQIEAPWAELAQDRLSQLSAS